MFRYDQNLHKHVTFNTNFAMEGSSLKDLIITTKRKSILDVTDAGHIQEFMYQIGIWSIYRKNLNIKTNQDPDC
jgi:hypothetical protein